MIRGQGQGPTHHRPMKERITNILAFAMATAIMTLTVYGGLGVEPGQTGYQSPTQHGLRPASATR